MTRKHPDVHLNRHRGNHCCLRKVPCPDNAMPLSKACCRGRVRVCRIRADRKTCARMAHLGLLPGSELELICSGRGNRCMVRVNGGTISLDQPMADGILVTPA